MCTQHTPLIRPLILAVPVFTGEGALVPASRVTLYCISVRRSFQKNSVCFAIPCTVI